MRQKGRHAVLLDELTGELIALAKAVKDGENTPETDRLIMDGLFTAITNVAFDSDVVRQKADAVRAVTATINPCCACSGCCSSEPYSMNDLWTADEDIRSLKTLILLGLRGMGAYAYHAMVLGYSDPEVNAFFYEGLRAVGTNPGADELLGLVLKTGEVNFKCMALLDKANTETYGTPAPTTVPLTVEKGPFIIITGHDLLDLQMLLEQTKDKGINIYTHGEMLPAHAYPKLKAYPHLKGNFGTAWQNQQKEFDAVPAPILFTTNCLMPVKPSYADRVFTTEVVCYPEMTHIGEGKDFTPVIEKALALGGYAEDRVMTGVNGGTQVTTGFGWERCSP